MTKITLDQMSAYLNAGAPLDDVISMIEMLQIHKEEILAGIADWQDLIPELPEDPQAADDLRGYGGMQWGDWAQHKDLKTIVTWLMRLGYVVRRGMLRDNGDTCIWEIVKSEQVGRLHWECDRFFIEGLLKPEPSPNDADRFPECLICWE